MNLPKNFRIYLQIQGASLATIKNYLSDFNQFLNWLYQTTGISHRIAGKSIFGLFTQETLEEYQSYLVQKNIPASSVNRRFSTLRKLGRFAQEQGWIEENAAEKIRNVQKKDSQKQATGEQILGEFKKHLEEEKVSQLTIKNYLSDLRHFLTWLEVAT